MRAYGVLAIVLAACGGGSGDGGDGDADTDADTDTDTVTDSGTGTGTDADSDSDGDTDSDADTDSDTGSETETHGDALVGEECSEDVDCLTDVCWDFNDYDPGCFGAICSDVCASQEDCVKIAATAGAKNPELAECGDDDRCDLVSTGLGSFACSGG